MLAYEAMDLLRRGVHPARPMAEGMFEWRLAELPTDKSLAV